VTFGPFEFDQAARRLTRTRDPVHLTAKAMDLLALLASKQPDAVAKKDIHKNLWPDTFVSDVSLTTLIFELRSALGETARKPRFIRTVHGFGYAFQGDSGQSDPAKAHTPFVIIHDGRDIGLLRGDNLIGRSRDCRVRIDVTRVSRHHARVTVDGDTALIEDCGSRNGTWVGDQRTTGRVRLTDGDEVFIAGIRILFRVLSPGMGHEGTA
jgi:DNA-binding winged helix-turn-helix (wHTH) protein